MSAVKKLEKNSPPTFKENILNIQEKASLTFAQSEGTQSQNIPPIRQFQSKPGFESAPVLSPRQQ